MLRHEKHVEIVILILCNQATIMPLQQRGVSLQLTTVNARLDSLAVNANITMRCTHWSKICENRMYSQGGLVTKAIRISRTRILELHVMQTFPNARLWIS
jgi:hypothetical protein